MDDSRTIRNSDMTLVKDMQDHRIIYYWINQSSEVISPFLVSLERADEWRRDFLNNMYEGHQRRRSSIDRRRYQHKRDIHSRQGNVAALFQSGRRSTDRPARVGKDLAAEKLKRLFNEYQPQEDQDIASSSEPRS